MKIRIREATKNDWKFILKLRNQESSRLSFFNNENNSVLIQFDTIFACPCNALFDFITSSK